MGLSEWKDTPITTYKYSYIGKGATKETDLTIKPYPNLSSHNDMRMSAV